MNMIPDNVLTKVVDKYIRKHLRRVNPRVLVDLKKDLEAFNATSRAWDVKRKQRKQVAVERLQEADSDSFFTAPTSDGEGNETA